MSKSPNLVLPAVGGATLVMGLAYGMASREYGETRIEMLESRVEQVEASAAVSSTVADTQSQRAAELEAQIAEVQAAAVAARASGGSDLTAPAPASDGALGLGRAAQPAEIAAWDIDVLPDGRGLPEGSGDVWTGEEVFVAKCASCHGDFAEGVDNWPVLAGGFDTLADEDPVKTVGSYWPHLSTAWDYINRSMPFGEAGTLTADDTYAIVAYLLYSNDLVDDDFVLSHENFTQVEMPNADGFVVDDREAQEYANWRTEPCMENCKEGVDVTMRTVFLVDTPAEGGTVSVPNPMQMEELPSFTVDGPSFIPAAAATAHEEATPEVAEEAAASGDEAAMIADGEKLFRRCASCHAIGPNARTKSGPHLNNIVGRVIGSIDGFRYSSVFKTAMEEGRIWDEEALSAFIENPRGYLKGTKMSFSGLRDAEDRDALIAYLKSVEE